MYLDFIICQLSFNASSIWGKITTRFGSSIPMILKCAIYSCSNLGKQSSNIRFIFLKQSRYNTFLTHSSLSTTLLLRLLLGLCTLNVATTPAGPVSNWERGNWYVILSIFVMILKSILGDRGVASSDCYKFEFHV